jgi:hypothetical protein
LLTTQPRRWGYNLHFQGEFNPQPHAGICNKCYNFYLVGESFKSRDAYYVLNKLAAESRSACFGEPDMKLHLITASIVAYTILAMAWICYSELVLP